VYFVDIDILAYPDVLPNPHAAPSMESRAHGVSAGRVVRDAPQDALDEAEKKHLNYIARFYRILILL
jgi:hypothetical protein